MNMAAGLFTKTFGEMLLPLGFFLWRDGFYRIDSQNGLVWMVVMQQMDARLPCNVHYGVKAFCHGLDENALKGDIYQMGGLWRHAAGSIDKSRLHECDYAMEINAMVFRDLILERFQAVQNLKDLQAFRAWNGDLMGIKREHGLWAMNEMWEDICLRDYDAALQSMQLAFEKWLAVCERKPAGRTEPESLRKGEMFLRMQRWLQDGNGEALDEAVRENMERSRSACKSYFKLDI